MGPRIDGGSPRSTSLLQRLTRRRGLLIGLVLLGVILITVSGTLLWRTMGPAAPPPTPSPPHLEPPPSMEELAQQYPELGDLLTDPTLGSVYKDFVIAYEQGGLEAARELALQRGLLNDREEIRITLVADSAENVPPLVEELQQVGITVEGSYEERINIGVPLSLIQQLAAQQGTEALFQQLTQMEHIIRLELPMPNRPFHPPPVQGEGVSIINADAWHAAGFTGQGIRIGVLDLGFDGYPSLLGSELPPSVTAQSFVYGREADESGEIHGTACAEIIHEVAPDAALFLAYYDGTVVSEGQAVEWLLDQGVHIISHSAGSILGPMDGSGEHAELADKAAAQGILWINAMGNEGEGHYRGLFTDTDGDGFHEFPDGKEDMAVWPYTSEVMITLNWDDWENVTEDYNLILYDARGDLLASSEDIQNGGPGQIAAEGFTIQLPSETVYYVSIQAHRTTRAATLDLYTAGADVEFPVAEHSLNTPADARGALGVGATEYRDDLLAPYSSQGPTSDGRLKPELVAPTGISSATYGQQGFDGTSASTPHVAGAAALVWSRFPDLGRAQIITYLTTNALDLGPPGPESGYGYGRLQLPPPPEEAGGTQLPTVPPLPTLAPLPTLDLALTPIPEITPIPLPLPIQPEIPGIASVRFALLCLLSLCGGAMALGGMLLLLVAWRRSRRSAPAPHPPRPAPAPTPLSPPPPPTSPGYGMLLGTGVRPMPLKEGATDIGRGPDNDVVLSHPSISRRHVQLQCAQGVCIVQDLQSSNGTYINGERIRQARLTPGDRLRLGEVELIYRTASGQRPEAWIDVEGTHHPVPTGGLSIGRSQENDLPLYDELASRWHARIEQRGKDYILVDQGSTNGVYVNGQRVQRHSLRNGDEIRIGRSRLYFHSSTGGGSSQTPSG